MEKNQNKILLQRPDLWATEELGRGEWMTNGDVEKLRKMYECDGRKFIRFRARGGHFST